MDMRKVEQRWRFARVIVRLSITKLSTLMRGPSLRFSSTAKRTGRNNFVLTLK